MGAGGQLKSNSIPNKLKTPGRYCDGAGLYLVVTKPGGWALAILLSRKLRHHR